MSRIGQAPIPLPSSVTVTVGPELVGVKGPRGELSLRVNSAISVEVSDSVINVSRPSDSREHRSLHGLTRSLVFNMVTGVTEGFQKTLDLVGVGYRVQQSGQDIVLQVGFSHPVNIKPLPGVTLEVEGNNRINVSGNDKQMVGEVAAQIRKVRPPNAYTGKGVRYSDERVRLKPGKSAARAT
jgi:large subunit ribosomal protein L6